MFPFLLAVVIDVVFLALCVLVARDILRAMLGNPT